MSWFQNLVHGSFLSDDSLLQTREGYQPLHSSAAPASPPAYEHWTRRMTAQHELGIAREMAGLSDAVLGGLAAEFERSPRRKRTDALRLATPAGVCLLIVGGLALLFNVGLRWGGAASLPWVDTAAAVTLVAGLVSISAGVLASFSAMPLDVAHGKVGLCVGLLDEQHPWLYQAASLRNNRAAEAYRLAVLRERGPLRGIDCMMMREIARADEALESTRIARVVACELNAPAVANPMPNAPDPQTGELPRLASVPVYGDAADALFDPLAGSVRAFGVNTVDRRRQG